MSGLENLTSKILEDAQSQAQDIAKAAEVQAREIMDKAAAEAKAEVQHILAEGEAEAKHRAEQLVLGKTLEIRDRNLEARQQMLERVFDEALYRLDNLPKEQFLKFLTDYLKQIDITDEEIILPKKYGITDLSEINAALKKAGKNGNLTLSKDSRDISGGFVLVSGGVEENNTFKALINYRRYTLESEVLGILY